MIELNTNVLGAFALKDGRIIKSFPFPRDPKAIAERLLAMEKGTCAEDKKLLEYLMGTGTKEVKTREPDRFSQYFGSAKFVKDDNPTPLSVIANELGVSAQEVRDLLVRANIEATRVSMKGISRDQMIMQAVSSLDELEESANTLIKRLREWYSLTFPELDFTVKKHDLYAKLVATDLGAADEGLREKLERERQSTLGVAFKPSDSAAAKRLAESILELYAAKEKIEAYVAEAMEEVAPNISALAGPSVGARLISLAGGLDRLSIMPASTIQILGAEDAFFRFLKTGRDPPKHGVIFQLPEIRSAGSKARGKLSRMVAAKLATAAKVDRFGGEFIGDRLRADFEKKAEKLR